jgi:hypothetical protein
MTVLNADLMAKVRASLRPAWWRCPTELERGFDVPK